MSDKVFNKLCTASARYKLRYTSNSYGKLVTTSLLVRGNQNLYYTTRNLYERILDILFIFMSQVANSSHK